MAGFGYNMFYYCKIINVIKVGYLRNHKFIGLRGG